ncbi:MAG: hypothetical protein A3K10_16585 [Bacteroidetes bacterium RIFCSPLOWO2_12_FULL_31_6]|nr:MAG: hypothetical protein A3K10_16585 [Bacteroidetes bacterium RIFCSPLOWO2_12_FULL_31_6]
MIDDIAKRLKEVRTVLKMNQTEFSSSIGIEQTYLSQLENGKIGVGNKILLTLIEKHNISIDWLLTGTGSMFKLNEIEAIKIIYELEKMLMGVKNKRLNTI